MRGMPLVVGIATVCVLVLVGGLYLNRSRIQGNLPSGTPDATKVVTVARGQVATAEPTQVPAPRATQVPTAVNPQVGTPGNAPGIATACGGADARLNRVSVQPEPQAVADSTPEI